MRREYVRFWPRDPTPGRRSCSNAEYMRFIISRGDLIRWLMDMLLSLSIMRCGFLGRGRACDGTLNERLYIPYADIGPYTDRISLNMHGTMRVRRANRQLRSGRSTRVEELRHLTSD
jgi:hypothetical protein